MDFPVEIEELLEMAALCGAADIGFSWPIPSGNLSVQYRLSESRTIAAEDQWQGHSADLMIQALHRHIAPRAPNIDTSHLICFPLNLDLPSGPALFRCQLTPNDYGHRTFSMRVLKRQDQAPTRSTMVLQDRQSWLASRIDRAALAPFKAAAAGEPTRQSLSL